MNPLKSVVFWIFVIVIAFLVFLKVLFSITIGGITDIDAEQDPKIPMGEGEFCESPQFSLECQPGLVCVLIKVDKSGEIGVCLPPNATEGTGYIERSEYERLGSNPHLINDTEFKRVRSE
ncbi:MAG: hypothetical protein ACOCXG_01210 [Nanoarchaeota archaeon]